MRESAELFKFCELIWLSPIRREAILGELASLEDYTLLFLFSLRNLRHDHGPLDSAVSHRRVVGLILFGLLTALKASNLAPMKSFGNLFQTSQSFLLLPDDLFLFLFVLGQVLLLLSKLPDLFLSPLQFFGSYRVHRVRVLYLSCHRVLGG